MADLHEALEVAVTRFRAWADQFPVAERSGEWECLYDDWQTIYNAFRAFVDVTNCQDWDEAIMQMLLYIIARDNEMQVLVKEVAERPDHLMCLSEHAIGSSEPDAKWQLAAALGRVEQQTPQAEALLLQFADDPDEYVRRRSLLALADSGSSHVESLAVSAWETGDEYQQAAALYALWKVGSPQLETYLAQAEYAGREDLISYMERVRAGSL